MNKTTLATILGGMLTLSLSTAFANTNLGGNVKLEDQRTVKQYPNGDTVQLDIYTDFRIASNHQCAFSHTTFPRVGGTIKNLEFGPGKEICPNDPVHKIKIVWRVSGQAESTNRCSNFTIPQNATESCLINLQIRDGIDPSRPVGHVSYSSSCDFTGSTC